VLQDERAQIYAEIRANQKDWIERGQYLQPEPISCVHQGKRVRAIHNRILMRPLEESFHRFILSLLWDTVGRDWLALQMETSPETLHAIAGWTLSAQSTANSMREGIARDPEKAGTTELTGDALSLLTLAHDIFRLLQVNELPGPLLSRLRDRRQFQGARYEVAVAAAFVRCGFTIKWIRGVTKHGEFVAIGGSSREELLVETKSRVWPGVLHEPSAERFQQSVRVAVGRLYRKAIEKPTGGRPFFIFVDLNLPHEPAAAPMQKSWMNDIKGVLDDHIALLIDGTPETLLAVTNLGSHHIGTGAATPAEVLFLVSQLPRVPVKDWNIFEHVATSLRRHAYVPYDC
jgi:hypothetical protein